MALLSVVLALATLAVPPVAALGLAFWTRGLRNRAALPRYAGWTAYVIVGVVSTMTIGTLLGLIQSFVALRALGLSAAQKQSILASAIAEAFYDSALGVPVAIVGAVWLGVFTWRHRNSTEGTVKTPLHADGPIVDSHAMCIERIVPDTPEAAMALLWGGHSRWKDDRWIFRGHGDSTWQLLPSAYRAKPPALLYDPTISKMVRGPRKHILAQIHAEWGTLRLFLRNVDHGGLPFATPDPALFEYAAYIEKYEPLMNRIKTGNTHEWPPDDLLPNLGLAQHYGIHTRLLDWTTSLQTAGYFASVKGAELFKSGKDGFFTIWGMREDFLHHAANKRSSFARIVRVPRASNANLHAQDGVFVNYWPYGDDGRPEAPFAPMTFDDALKAAWAKLKAGDTGKELDALMPPLVRVDMPWRFAGHVLRSLSDMGYGPSRFFPGYDGAARAVMEREFWA